MTEMLLVEIYPALHDMRAYKAKLLGKSPSKCRYKLKTSSNTFGYSVIFDVRKTKDEKKTMGLTEMLFLCYG